MKLLCSIAVGIGLAHLSFGFVPENPGLRLRFTQHLLDEIWNMTTTAVQYAAEHKMKARKSPIKFGKKSKMTNVTMGTGGLNFAEPNKLVLKLRGAQLSMESKQKIMDENRKNHKGIATIHLSNTTVDMTFTFGRTEENRLSFDMTNCSFEIGESSMTIEKFENATDYMKKMANVTGSMMGVMMSGMVCPMLTQFVAMSNLQMGNYPLVMPLGKKRRAKLGMDFSLTDDPKATSQYLQFDFSGYVSNLLTQDRMAIDFDPHPLVDKVNNTRMMYAFVSDEVVNQLISEHYKIEGKKGYTMKLTKKHQEPYEEMVGLIGKVGEKVGKSFKVPENGKFKFSLTEAPTVHFKPNKEKPKHDILLKGQVRLEFPVVVDDDDEVMTTVLFAIEKVLQVTLNTPEGKRFPRIDLASHIVNLTVIDVFGDPQLEDVVFTEETLKEAAELFKGSVDKHMRQLLKKAVSAFNEAMDEAEEDKKSIESDDESDDDDSDEKDKDKETDVDESGESGTDDDDEDAPAMMRYKRSPGRRGHGHKNRMWKRKSNKRRFGKFGLRRRERRLGKTVSMPNVQLEFFKHTAVLGLDVKIDMMQIMEEIENKKRRRKTIKDSSEEKADEDDDDDDDDDEEPLYQFNLF